MQRKDAFRGCLLGGAIGDALGRPVEFMDLNEIKRNYGTQGIQDLVLRYGHAEITDDTQMTLFTAEGILRAETRGREKGICDPATVVYYAYQRWLHTQGYPQDDEYLWIYDGRLLKVKGLFKQRGPGNTCLSALKSRQLGTMEAPINNSKGCGGVMRVAPAGLFYPLGKAFQMGAEFAALTHGHPSGYLSAGALAHIIASLMAGYDLEPAVGNTLDELERYDHHKECSQILRKALELACSNLEDETAIAQLGEGWVGEEALAISVFCALKYSDDFTKAVTTAVNHAGDSDSTGAITGNILGAYCGLGKIPPDWVVKVEHREVLTQIADDLLTGYQDSEEWREKYPGY